MRSLADMDSRSGIEPSRGNPVALISRVCFGRSPLVTTEVLACEASVQDRDCSNPVQLYRPARKVMFDPWVEFWHPEEHVIRRGQRHVVCPLPRTGSAPQHGRPSGILRHQPSRLDVQGGSCRSLRPCCPCATANVTVPPACPQRHQSALTDSASQPCCTIRPDVQGGSCRPLHLTAGSHCCVTNSPSCLSLSDLSPGVQGGSCRPLCPALAADMYTLSMSPKRTGPDPSQVVVRWPTGRLTGRTDPPPRTAAAATSASDQGDQTDNTPCIDASEVAPFSRPVTQSAAAGSTRQWFTFFGSVEGHQVLLKDATWGDQQCVQEAIAHAAPALARPTGRVIQRPLPGLFTPQLVLTRMPVGSRYRTVVFDLRPIGADLRAEDVRTHGNIATLLFGEGALAPLARSLRLEPEAVSFSVNLLPSSADAMITERTETVTVHFRATGSCSAAEASSSETTPHDRRQSSDLQPAGRPSRWGSGTRWDHRPYRPLRPPTPPLPEEATGDLGRVDQALADGLTFTVFDTHFHRRTLQRSPGQTVAELVEVAMSLTPNIRRPWGFHIIECIWEDLPSPQIVVWGGLLPSHRVFPIRDLDAPDRFCTVMVPIDYTPLQVLIEAGARCPAFVQAKVQVARLTKVFQVNHMSVPPYEANAVRLAQVASVRMTFGPTLPARRPGLRWQPDIPNALQVLRPAEAEDLWPVLEVAVHFQGRACHRVVLPLSAEARTLLEQVVQGLGLSFNCGFRLPTYCRMRSQTHGMIPHMSLIAAMDLLICADSRCLHGPLFTSSHCRRSLTFTGFVRLWRLNFPTCRTLRQRTWDRICWLSTARPQETRL